MNVVYSAALITRAMLVGLVATSVVATALPAQQGTTAPRTVARLVAEPASVSMEAGDSLAFRVVAYDAQGNVIPDAAIRVGGPRRALYFGEGQVKAFQAGTFTAVASAQAPSGLHRHLTLRPHVIVRVVLRHEQVDPAGPRLSE